jgi:signal transduction histidine kinase
LHREREDIMGFVAHELRNPLANIILCNDIMTDALQKNETQVMNDMLEKTKKNVTRLQKMITELYEATVVNSGHLKLQISVFHFGQMIKEAVGTIESLQPAYRIVIDGDTEFTVEADRLRLMQVVTNLLSNAIKYSNGNADVLLTVSRDETSAKVAVQDKGIGIAKEMLPFLFERFFRVQKTRNIEGIGLGLYLCQQIVIAHNGKIWAESNEGQGSTFYFTIPLNFNS